MFKKQMFSLKSTLLLLHLVRTISVLLVIVLFLAVINVQAAGRYATGREALQARMLKGPSNGKSSEANPSYSTKTGKWAPSLGTVHEDQGGYRTIRFSAETSNQGTVMQIETEKV